MFCLFSNWIIYRNSISISWMTQRVKARRETDVNSGDERIFTQKLLFRAGMEKLSWKSHGKTWESGWKSLENSLKINLQHTNCWTFQWKTRSVMFPNFMHFISMTPANPNAILFAEFPFSPRRRMLCLLQTRGGTLNGGSLRVLNTKV